MLTMDPAFTWHDDIEQTISRKKKEKTTTFRHRDQIAAEILYFAGCVLNDKEPEPSGREGLIDVRIMEALRQSYTKGKPVKLKPLPKQRRPHASQSIKRRPSANRVPLKLRPLPKSDNSDCCEVAIGNVRTQKFLRFQRNAWPTP